MNIDKYYEILAKVNSYKATLVAVSKTKPISDIQALHKEGQLVFGENKVQELCLKQEEIEAELEWHMIGHLQRNKVKYMAPFVSLIHGVDSFKLLKEIDKQAAKNNRIQDCLLQVFIAKEESKFGFSEEEVAALLKSDEISALKNVRFRGYMGMATNTKDKSQVRQEFKGLKNLFDQTKQLESSILSAFDILSMGMSGDFEMALEEGSTMVRVGSLIFGERNYVN